MIKRIALVSWWLGVLLFLMAGVFTYRMLRIELETEKVAQIQFQLLNVKTEMRSVESQLVKLDPPPPGSSLTEGLIYMNKWATALETEPQKAPEILRNKYTNLREKEEILNKNLELNQNTTEQANSKKKTP